MLRNCMPEYLSSFCQIDLRPVQFAVFPSTPRRNAIICTFRVWELWWMFVHLSSLLLRMKVIRWRQTIRVWCRPILGLCGPGAQGLLYIQLYNDLCHGLYNSICWFFLLYSNYHKFEVVFWTSDSLWTHRWSSCNYSSLWKALLKLHLINIAMSKQIICL